MSEKVDDVRANRADFFTEPAFELFVCGTQREIGPGSDQIHHGLGLGQVHLAVEKSALGEFAWARGPGAGGETRLENLRRDENSAVATDLDQIFSGVTGRRAMDAKHDLIDHRPST